MREIGGYFQMENLCGEDYYPDLIKLNLGRTALLYLMKDLDIQKLRLPRYICDSVVKICHKAGYPVSFYSVDEKLNPIIESPLEQGEYLYLINYYGQLSDEKILALKGKYEKIIVDHTHSFFQRPLKEVPTLYSVRKFFGVSDGAYLWTGGAKSWMDPQMLEKDISNGRMSHVLGRYEESASAYYSHMLDNAHSLEEESVKQMSVLTENLLRGIDYHRAKTTREKNYQVLEKLQKKNGLNWEMPQGPLAYPFYFSGGKELRKLLAAKKIYVPVYWSNVIETMDQDTVEHDYAANILPLPCDQRYNEADMEFLAECCLECIEELEKIGNA